MKITPYPRNEADPAAEPTSDYDVGYCNPPRAGTAGARQIDGAGQGGRRAVRCAIAPSDRGRCGRCGGRRRNRTIRLTVPAPTVAADTAWGGCAAILHDDFEGFAARAQSYRRPVATRAAVFASTAVMCGNRPAPSGHPGGDAMKFWQSAGPRRGVAMRRSVAAMSALALACATIPAGSWPIGVAVTPDDSKVNADGKTVSVISTGTNAASGSPIPIGKSLYGTDIPPDLIATLQSDLTQDKDYDKLYKSCFEEPGTPPLEEHVIAWRLDFNRPQQIALALRGRNCLGGNDNGELYLYIRAGNGWRKLLHTWGQSLYVCTREVLRCRLRGEFERKSTSRYGWPDLAVWRHNSAHDGDQLVFQFDGKLYEAVTCHRVSYQNPHGKPNSKPTYSPCLLSWSG